MALPIHSDREFGETLIDKASKGDLEAFNEIVLCFQHMAYSHAYALSGDPDAADDITQESFIKAYRNINGFRGRSFRAWLLRIVTNTFYDQWRKSRKFSVLSLTFTDSNGNEIDSPAWLVDPTESIQTTVEKNEDVNRLYHVLDEMPVAYRSAITLVDLFEIDYKEAANILNIPLGTVKSRLARARLQIKEMLLTDRG